MTFTETPPAGPADVRCVKGGGTRIPSGRCGDDGKTQESRIRSAFVCLPLSLNVAALGRPGVFLSRHCATSLAIRQRVGLCPRQRGFTTISEPYFIVFIGFATAIGNGTDGLSGPTA